VTLIFTAAHNDIYSMEDLAQLDFWIWSKFNRRSVDFLWASVWKPWCGHNRNGRGKSLRGFDHYLSVMTVDCRVADHLDSSCGFTVGNWVWPKRSKHFVLTNLRARFACKPTVGLKPGLDVVKLPFLERKVFGFGTERRWLPWGVISRICHLITVHRCGRLRIKVFAWCITSLATVDMIKISSCLLHKIAAMVGEVSVSRRTGS